MFAEFNEISEEISAIKMIISDDVLLYHSITNITNFGRNYTYIETLWKEVKYIMKWPYSMQLNQSRNILFLTHLFYEHIWFIEH